MKTSEKNLPDLDCSKNIQLFVDLFYKELLSDHLLTPIFIDVAKIDIQQHKSIIVSYWEKLLLGSTEYQRHTMNIHRHIYQQQAFNELEFKAWFSSFTQVLDHNFSGEKSEQAKRVAARIIQNMFVSLTGSDQLLDLHQ